MQMSLARQPCGYLKYGYNASLRGIFVSYAFVSHWSSQLTHSKWCLSWENLIMWFIVIWIVFYGLIRGLTKGCGEVSRWVGPWSCRCFVIALLLSRRSTRSPASKSLPYCWNDSGFTASNWTHCTLMVIFCFCFVIVIVIVSISPVPCFRLGSLISLWWIFALFCYLFDMISMLWYSRSPASG